MEEETVKTAGIQGANASSKRLFSDMDTYKNINTRELVKMLNGDDFVDAVLVHKVLKVRGYTIRNARGKIVLRKIPQDKTPP